MNPKELRQQVIRQVRYALNVVALESNAVPSEGPIDVAITNGLAAIVALEFPDELCEKNGRIKSASQLLKIVEDIPEVDAPALIDLLKLTQPLRHGGADDEWLGPGPGDLAAVEALDDHLALGVLDNARSEPNVDALIVKQFRLAALSESGFDLLSPKDRLEVIDPQDCPECWRLTFIITGFDAFGGFDSPGTCLACGYQLDAEDAYQNAVATAMRRLSAD